MPRKPRGGGSAQRPLRGVAPQRAESRLYYVIYGPRPRFKCMQSNRACARPSLSFCTSAGVCHLLISLFLSFHLVQSVSSSVWVCVHATWESNASGEPSCSGFFGVSVKSFNRYNAVCPLVLLFHLRNEDTWKKWI